MNGKNNRLNGGNNHLESINPYALSTWNSCDQRSSENVPVESRREPVPAVQADLGEETARDQQDDVSEAPGWDLGIEVDPNAKPKDFSRPEEYARRVLFQAKATAKKNGYFPRKSRIRGGTGQGFGVKEGSAGYSGSGPDARDPQKMNIVLEKMLVNLGWDRGMSTGRVLAEWEQIVGPQIAEHCQIVSFEEGLLVVSADSSAWASQLRMMHSQIITAVHAHVGAQVVSELRVAGPAAKSWKKGKRSVTWRGPRDTYG